jgi:APA family basic amino acid/polyamine antiporter
MIGSGIFIVTSDISRQLNSGALVLVAWLIAGFMTIAGGLCYGEFACAWPEAGGQYVYLKNIWGKLMGFLYGWTFFLVIETGTIAAISIAFAKFLSIVVPQISSDNKILSVLGFEISMLQMTAVLLIVVLTYINTRGVKSGALIQNIFTSTKILALLGVIFCGLFIGFNKHTLLLNLSTGLHLNAFKDMNITSAMAIALVGALFASDSWANVTFIAGEIKKPEKNLPRALFLGISIVILLYILINFSYFSVLTIDNIKTAHADVVGAALIGFIFGNIGQIAVSLIILISAVGCVNGIILSGARVYYAMAKDGLFFEKIAVLNEKTNAPQNALIIQGIWASLLIFSGSFLQLLDYVVFASLLFYILTIGGVFIFRRKYQDMQLPYRTAFYPYLPALYCILATFIAINLLIYKPAYTWPGLLIVLSGVPVYFLKRAYSKASINKSLEIND